MPVNHAKEFLRYIHIEALFSQLFASLKYKPRTVFESITQKSFDLISSFWSDLPKNHWAGWICDNLGSSNDKSLDDAKSNLFIF